MARGLVHLAAVRAAESALPDAYIRDPLAACFCDEDTLQKKMQARGHGGIHVQQHGSMPLREEEPAYASTW